MAPRNVRLSAAYLAIVAFVVLYTIVNATRPVPVWVAGLYLSASVVCFIAYSVDKSRAEAGRYRVAENTLIILGIAGGWPGAILAQQLLRHKTRKTSFQVAFWFSVIVNVGAFLFLASPLLPELIDQVAAE